MTHFSKNNPVTQTINNALINLPTPSNISSWWNFGSLLGICLMTQIISGIFLTMHFTADISIAFNSVEHIMRNTNNGWMIRLIHSNGASMFFVCLYLHLFRGLYFSSFYLTHTWTVGVTLMFLIMGTAFMGYVLPWGQMSFWGATVITNLLSAIPYVGLDTVQWVWGGFAVDNATLTRFFALHFLLPFFIVGLVMVHLIFLHQTGSSNPIGVNSNLDKIPFHTFFTWKDIFGVSLMMFFLIMTCLLTPYILGDTENFSPADPLVTPLHIQPEWYFLFAYAILRSIPNKLGGVMALIASISILYIMPLISDCKIKGNQFYPFSQILLWILLNTTILLTWIGARPVEPPFIFIGQMLTTWYFLLFFMWTISFVIWDYMK